MSSPVVARTEGDRHGPGLSPWRRRLTVVVALATAVYLVWLVVAHWSDIDRALVRFQGAQTRWLLAAIWFELVAQASAVAVQRRLLRRAGSAFGVLATARLVLAQNAITMALPGGQAVASVFAYRQIRRRGTDAAAAAWVVAATQATAMLALATFGAFTATGVSWLTVLTGGVLLVVLGVLITLASRPARLTRPAVALVRTLDRVRRPGPDAASPTDRVRERFARLSAVRMGWRDWLFTAVFALGFVAADCAVWICASHAMIVQPARCLAANATLRVREACASFHAPTTAGLLVAYSAGQAALQLPIPGGIGAVESFMTATLTAAKVRAIQALSAVMLYRVVSFWAVVAIGAVMWLSLRRRRNPA